ncbi:hypothetical protein HUS2011_pII0011 (plasmid) [Escherichia coli]|nr:hypothetical protein HUS2011_pII0011 [Escherichia coli]
MMSLWDALRMNMMISYQELVRTFPRNCRSRPGPVPWLKHFLLFSHFIIKITLNGRNQT